MRAGYLRVVGGNGAGALFPVGREFLLGRVNPDAAALADDADMSREHARVAEGASGELEIRDLDSRNGTFVNGDRIEAEQLAPGDLIQVGSTTLEVVLRPRSALYDDELMRPWYDDAITRVTRLSLFDVHGHVGSNDPDGFKFSSSELTATLAAAGARGVVMPMHEPNGYPPANDALLAESEASGGRLVVFCRVDPKRDGREEAVRCVDAGARGIKLHPRAEQFDLRHDGIDPVFALAHERRLPVLIHAGRGIATLARDAVSLAGKYPDARIILAHAAISDLNWIWREAPEHPNLFFDTAWWHPSDLAALFALIPPGQLLFGSDLPYFTPFMSAAMVIRHGLQVGLSEDQLRSVLGDQTGRLLAGEDPLDLGPPAGTDRLGQSIILERLTSVLVLAVGRMLMGRTGYEPLALARLACDLGDDEAPEAQVCRHVLALLLRQEHFARENPENGPPLAAGIRCIMLAACLSRTPDVGLPRIPDLGDHEMVLQASSSGHRSRAETRLMPSISRAPDLRRSSAADLLIIDADD
nr:amidohydrolase family protein [Actinomycetota bacterium]